MQRLDAEAEDDLLLRRWNRLRMYVRCGLYAHHSGYIRLYVKAGLAIARRDIRPAREVHLRVLQTLLSTGQDEALPWSWRNACLDHLDLPVANLTPLLAVDDPVALRAIEAGVQRARDGLPALPG
ncbi:hypothetical protein [Variovorax rhizosphaerae]|uniref:Uncharacterized protein n=1 Tax=Variovorax rhizosphaerae TaxID=1836200 RepID=A0ABU8WIC8_9BURK